MSSGQRIADYQLKLYFELNQQSPEVHDRLVQLFADRADEDLNTIQDGRANGLSMAEISKLRGDVAQRYDQLLDELLGAEEASRLKQFTSATMYVPIAEDFASRCAAIGEPVSRQTVAAIAMNFRTNLRPPENPGSLAPNGTPAEKERAIKSAQGILSAAQLDVLKTMLSEQPSSHP